MSISERLKAKEWIDLGLEYYTAAEYSDCLYQLARIGRYLGGDRATYRSFDKLNTSPTSILDVGCGGGLFTMRLAHRYPLAKIVGIDTSCEAIEIANEKLRNAQQPITNVEFQVPPSPQLHYPEKSFDVVTTTLVCHHLTDDELILFLKNACSIAKHAVIINDLHRHPLATYGYTFVAPLFFRNRIVIHDGLLSIKRAFVYKDWIAYLSAASIPIEKCSITWNWAFRWVVTINVEEFQ